ncbi:MAG: signal peptide peptidase SppA [Alphaproteobacteria bacterium]|nr:signal peptide peptidase SppA [Alphaproteobacteria bacterium]
MPISADTLLDRMYLKSQVMRWRTAAIVLAVLAVAALFHTGNVPSKLGNDYIARVTLDSIIMDDPDVYELLEDLAGNKHVRAVIVQLDTPGGSAVGGEETYIRLRELSTKKPVVAVMRSVAASAGYMVALGADRIFAREGTITGSIGVIIEAAEVTDLAERIGVKPIIIKSSALKSTLSPFEKASPESLKVVQTLIDDFYGRFVDIVTSERKLPRDEVLKLADGRVYGGKRAVDLKLVDAIGGEQEAVAWLEESRKLPKDLDILDEDIKPPLGVLEQLTQSTFLGKFFQNSRIKLDGLVAIWHPSMS